MVVSSNHIPRHWSNDAGCLGEWRTGRTVGPDLRRLGDVLYTHVHPGARHLAAAGARHVRNPQCKRTSRVVSWPASPSYITRISPKALSMFGTCPNSNSCRFWDIERESLRATLPPHRFLDLCSMCRRIKVIDCCTVLYSECKERCASIRPSPCRFVTARVRAGIRMDTIVLMAAERRIFCGVPEPLRPATSWTSRQ